MLVPLLTGTAVLLRILSNPLANVFQKQLTLKHSHPLIINFLTYLLLSMLCIPIITEIKFISLPQQFWIYSVLAGIAGGLGNSFLVKALQKGDLSVLGPINSYKSVVGIFVAVFLLNEIPNLWGIAGVVFIIYGSYFVLNTTREKFTRALLKKPEIQFRIWAMILTAFEAVFIKKIILASSVTIAFVCWCWFGALFSFILIFIYRIDLKNEMQKVGKEHFLKYILLVMSVGTMQFSTNYVFNHISVGYALSLFQLSIIISVIFGHHFFKEEDIGKKLIGSVIMIAGSVMIILLKN